VKTQVFLIVPDVTRTEIQKLIPKIKGTGVSSQVVNPGKIKPQKTEARGRRRMSDVADK
jgi:hypothetical protein